MCVLTVASVTRCGDVLGVVCAALSMWVIGSGDFLIRLSARSDAVGLGDLHG